MKFHAVVVNYKTPADLKRFLETWEAQIPYRIKDWELTIANVDPTSTDLDVAEAHVSARISHKIHEQNVGYAFACNTAVMNSDADYFAFFNADVWFRDDAIDKTLMAMIEGDWGVCGPRQVDSKRKFTHAGIFGTHEAPKHRAWHHTDRGDYTDTVEAITVAGSAYFIKGDVWRDLAGCPIFKQFLYDQQRDCIGAFLPTKHYYEETWCSYHAWKHGYKVMYFGGATVVHEWHKASPLGGHADKLMAESQAMFRAACDVHDIPCD